MQRSFMTDAPPVPDGCRWDGYWLVMYGDNFAGLFAPPVEIRIRVDKDNDLEIESAREVTDLYIPIDAIMYAIWRRDNPDGA
jgi:hypothetical protein